AAPACARLRAHARGLAQPLAAARERVLSYAAIAAASIPGAAGGSCGPASNRNGGYSGVISTKEAQVRATHPLAPLATSKTSAGDPFLKRSRIAATNISTPTTPPKPKGQPRPLLAPPPG